MEGVLERGGSYKKGQGYKKLLLIGFTFLVLSKKTSADAEDRTGQENFDTNKHEIRNWPYYDEIALYFEVSLK